MVPQQEMVHEFLENSAKKKMRWRMIKENVHSGRQKKKKNTIFTLKSEYHLKEAQH
jgi:hypothetical protein